MAHYALLNESKGITQAFFDVNKEDADCQGFYGAVRISCNTGDGSFYEWDEENQQWVEVPEI
jgi:hypothetical protein